MARYESLTWRTTAGGRRWRTSWSRSGGDGGCSRGHHAASWTKCCLDWSPVARGQSWRWSRGSSSSSSRTGECGWSGSWWGLSRSCSRTCRGTWSSWTGTKSNGSYHNFTLKGNIRLKKTSYSRVSYWLSFLQIIMYLSAISLAVLGMIQSFALQEMPELHYGGPKMWSCVLLSQSLGLIWSNLDNLSLFGSKNRLIGLWFNFDLLMDMKVYEWKLNY